MRAKQLAMARCSEGYSALHYAARYGYLDQILNGATARQLTKVKGPTGWIYSYDAHTGIRGETEILGGVTALAVAIEYGHLDQIKHGVTLRQLDAAKDLEGATALDALQEMMDDPDPVALANNIVGCPEIIGLLDATKQKHVRALRLAVNRNHALQGRLSAALSAEVL